MIEQVIGQMGQTVESSMDDPSGPSRRGVLTGPGVKWSWACRALDLESPFSLMAPDGPPRVGEVALVRIDAVGHHQRVTTSRHGKLRLYAGDYLIGLFGNRYATDGYEGEVQTSSDLHMLTDAGMIGTVLSRSQSVKTPTRLSLVGYLESDSQPGSRINLKGLLGPSEDAEIQGPSNVLLVVGTRMNSGKTTSAARLIKALMRRGVRVAACKLTGSVCQNDLGELRATGAVAVRDFSDYGYPSTYKVSAEELRGLASAILADVDVARPDVIVMEIADGLLQRETQMLIHDEQLRRRVDGVLLTATCAASGLFGIEHLEGTGHRVVAVSGLITNSPLAVREFHARSEVPVASSSEDGEGLARVVAAHFEVAS